MVAGSINGRRVGFRGDGGSVFKILLFSNRDNTDNQLVLDNPECCRFFPNHDPVAWFVSRARFYFPGIEMIKRVSCIILKGNTDRDACARWQCCIFLISPEVNRTR